MSTPIHIRPAEGTWVIRAGGAVIGESAAAMELTEGDLPFVIYFPREDVAMAFLDRTDHSTTCPHKGKASHFSIMSKSRTYENAVWSFEDASGDLAPIKGYLAFAVQDGVAVEQV